MSVVATAAAAPAPEGRAMFTMKAMTVAAIGNRIPPFLMGAASRSTSAASLPVVFSTAANPMEEQTASIIGAFVMARAKESNAANGLPWTVKRANPPSSRQRRGSTRFTSSPRTAMQINGDNVLIRILGRIHG